MRPLQLMQLQLLTPGVVLALSITTQAATITVPAGGDVQGAINVAQCGDTIILQAGAIWDRDQPYLISKDCAVLPVLITTSQALSLPAGRVSPSHAPLMARLRTTGSGGIFQTQKGAGGLVLDGLELTDNISGNTVGNFLLDFGSIVGARNITVQRSYLHPKEIGTTDYTRNLIRAVQFEGSGMLYRNNYAAGFLGRTPDGVLQTTEIILCVTCSNLTVDNNFNQAWYASLFTGGGNEEPEFIASLSGDPTTDHAEFSDTTGLKPGMYVRFTLGGTGTLSSQNSFTRASGKILTKADVNNTIWIKNDRETLKAKITAVDGNTFSLQPYNNGVIPSDVCSFSVFEVAEVTSTEGVTVHYKPVGLNGLTQAPSVPGQAAWRLNQVVHDITITRNTFDIDVAHARFEHQQFGNSPKGWGEFKSGDGITFDGNEMTGYPSAWVFTQHSNEAATPWTQVKNVRVSNNYSHPIYDPSGSRQFLILALIDPYGTDEPGANVVVSNNLVLNSVNLMQLSGTQNVSVTHNTVINDRISEVYSNVATTAEGGPSFNFSFTDNVIGASRYGVQCLIDPNTLATCYPSARFAGNVVVDWNNNGLDVNSWGASSILSPVVNSFDLVGFADPRNGNYALSTASPYKGKAGDGKDPGVDMVKLMAALGGSVASPLPSPTATPVATPQPSPIASPVPLPVPSPLPSPTPDIPSTCTMAVNSPALPPWASGKMVVTFVGLAQLGTVNVSATSGQVTVSPTSKPVNGTSMIAEFLLTAKKKSSSVVVSGPCGSKTVLVNVQ